jgi:cell division protein FtsZ
MNEDRVRLIGLGGAGGRVAGLACAQLGGAPACVAVNTDASELEASGCPARIQVGATSLHGLGTGGDPAAGRCAGEEDAGVVRGLFEGVELAIVTVGLGGGAGTGLTPLVTAAAQEAGALVLCFATLPFAFEGARRTQVAQAALDELTGVDALVVAPNRRLFDAAATPEAAPAFQRANEIQATGLCGIVQMVTNPGYLALDFGGLRRAFQDGGGYFSFGVGVADGPDRARRAAESAIGSPMLEGGQIVGRSPSLLVSIVAGEDLRLKEVGEIMDRVTARAPEQAETSMGVALRSRWPKEEVAVTVLACEPWSSRPRPAHAELFTPAGEPAKAPPSLAKPARRRRSRGEMLQEKLSLDSSARGRFKDVEPTLQDGQDLDIPTFIRRGIKIGESGAKP